MSEPVAARVIWWLAGLAFLGVGVGCVWWPASQNISAVRTQSRELYDEANQLDAEIRRAGELRAVGARVLSDVERLGGQRSNGAATAAALELLGAESRRFDVELRSVVPQNVAKPLERAAAHPPELLAQNELVLGLRGRFRNVLAFVADLPRHDALIEVRGVTLSAAGASPDGTPALDATVEATLYRLREAPLKEVSRVSSARR